jgi:hypothetical protein
MMVTGKRRLMNYAWLVGMADSLWMALMSCQQTGGNRELGAESQGRG